MNYQVTEITDIEHLERIIRVLQNYCNAGESKTKGRKGNKKTYFIHKNPLSERLRTYDRLKELTTKVMKEVTRKSLKEGYEKSDKDISYETYLENQIFNWVISDAIIEDALDWSIEKFGNEKNDIQVRKMKHLREECGEVIEAIKEEKPIEELKLEYADCLILLLTSARQDGFSIKDLRDGWIEKMAINKLRKWGEPNEHGYHNHIKK